MHVDDFHRISVVAGFFGAVLWALSNYFAAAFPPVRSLDDGYPRNKALVEGGFAIVAGPIGTWYIVPAFCEWRHVTDVQLVSLIALVTGMVFWRSIPGLVIKIIARVGSISESLK